MVHHHRIILHHPQKPAASPPPPPPKLPLTRSTALRLLLLFSLVYSILFFFPALLFRPESETPLSIPACAATPNNTICCDRSAFRADFCLMRGDVRTLPSQKSILLVSDTNISSTTEEKIRPYTRKWESSVMDTIDELRLRTTNNNDQPRCDVKHDVPAVVFSTGGYTGNVYHEFNDGILPLYITSQRFDRKVVFVALEYHDWWVTKYADVLSRLSDYPLVDFSGDSRTHCFPEAVVGLRIHDELSIDSSKMTNNKTIRDFRQLLDEAYTPRIRKIEEEESRKATNLPPKPKLVIISRNGSRSIENEKELEKTAEGVGFEVEVLRPTPTTELAKVYRSLNSCDVMIGVHGAGMTHFLFMRPGAVFIQVVPLGTDWAAEAYYGEPAAKMGLKYVRYQVARRESSLYRKYARDDPVLRDPESVNAKGWEVTKRVYLDGQKVRLDLVRFRKRLARSHQYLMSKRRRRDQQHES